MWHDALVNDEPMSKLDAQQLAKKLNVSDSAHYADENPLWETLDY
jgi:hypothetical protein